jgi:hypothetical protein
MFLPPVFPERESESGGGYDNYLYGIMQMHLKAA